MGATFSDITLYIPTQHVLHTPEYVEETLLHNFFSDLYVVKMNGYKPPNTTRVSVQPAFYNIWNCTWKNGSLVLIAPEFRRDYYIMLDKLGKYKYALDLIQRCMIQLSEEYKWDKQVFEKAYNDAITNGFEFKIHYPPKFSPDRKKTANLTIGKTEAETSLYAEIENGASTTKIKLFDKKNGWRYDGAYKLVKYAKWFDSDKFGISYDKGYVNIWYSLVENNVSFLINGNEMMQIDFLKKFYIY